MRRSVGRVVAALSVVVAVLVVNPGAAHASTSRCIVKWPSTSCKTATIPSNRTDHTIFYNMCSSAHYADWQIKDASNGVIVGQGRVPAGGICVTGHIRGLYGSYWGWVFNTRTSSIAYISNEQ
jgi:hypothetical protein